LLKNDIIQKYQEAIFRLMMSIAECFLKKL